MTGDISDWLGKIADILQIRGDREADLPAKQTRRIAYRCIAKKALPDSECD